MPKRILSAAEFYNVIANAYDHGAQTGTFSHPSIIFNAAAAHLTEDMKTLLDVGIGSGLSSLPFRQSGFEITGIDASPDMLALCARRNIANELILQDFSTENLPFEDDRFDISISHATLYMVPNADYAMEDIIRVTKPGGIVALNYDPSGFIVRENDAGPGQTVHTYGLEPDDVSDLFNRHGMEKLHADTAPAYQKFDGSWVRFETLVYRKPFSL